MPAHSRPKRIALVVHPTRSIGEPLATLERWARETGLELIQLPVVAGPDRQVAAPGRLEAGDLVVALGGDGTVLAALHASAPLGVPVLGVACGSVGALAAVMADDLGTSLERIEAGDWIERRLPALAVQPATAPREWALNDFVVVRRSTGQLVADVWIDEELYVRLAGDGLIVATPLGSTAYSMAAGGPVIASGTAGIVCTPLAMHGGSAPPLVVPAGSMVRVQVYPNFAGFDVEIDGRAHAIEAVDYRLSLHDDKVTLVSLTESGHGMAGLRERKIITDSPRVLARDARAARTA